MSNDDYLQALLRERHGYRLHGHDDRARQVDAELDRIGYVETAVEQPPEHTDLHGMSTRKLRAIAADAGVDDLPPRAGKDDIIAAIEARNQPPDPEPETGDTGGGDGEPPGEPAE